MSNKVIITGYDRYVYIELLGDMPIEKMYATNAFLYHDQSFIENPYAIWDFTGCTIDMEMEQVFSFAKKILADRHFDTTGKTAFITSDERIISKADPVANIMMHTTQIKGFHDRLSAVEWINDRGIEIIPL